MEILPFPYYSPSLLQEEPSGAQPLHDIRELFELAFPLTTDHAQRTEDELLDNVIPFKP